MEKISILKSKWFKKEVDKLQSGGMSKADIARQLDAVSYTHLTLPTICSV